MTDHFADRLLAACDAKGAPVCVGLDPVLKQLPESLRGEDAGEALFRFCNGVLEAVAPHVPAVKTQSACFERYGPVGMTALHRVISHAKSRGLIVILDAKRGDIGATAAHYAAATLGPHGGDAVTVNPYLGADGLQPFLDVALAHGQGLFALVRTSNPGGDAIQTPKLADGRTVAEMVADQVAALGASAAGSSGYSAVGAVVGATKPEDAGSLRRRMPKQIFLVPGFGAQGGTAEDIRGCFNADGRGALITASRSVIYAFQERGGGWMAAIEAAAKQLKQDVAAILQ